MMPSFKSIKESSFDMKTFPNFNSLVSPTNSHLMKTFPTKVFFVEWFWMKNFNFHYFHWISLAREKKTKKANFVVNNCLSQLHKQKPAKCVCSGRTTTTAEKLAYWRKQKFGLYVHSEYFLIEKCAETRHVSVVADEFALHAFKLDQTKINRGISLAEHCNRNFH